MKRSETDILCLLLKEDYRRYINFLQNQTKKQKEISANEKIQFYVFIDNLNMNIQEILNKNNLDYKIPSILINFTNKK